jgi:hypothetical protein
MNYSRGNILFIILIAIALFGALSFAVSQSKTGTAKNMSGEKLTIKVDQLLEYAQNVRSAVNFIYTHNNISESDIRFAHPELDAAYGDYTALNSEQMVFDPSGGGIDYKPAPAGINDGSDWFFTGRTCVSQVGTDGGAGGACHGVPNSELIMFLPNVTYEACVEIDRKLSLLTASGTPPQDDINMYNIATDHFSGTFGAVYSIYDSGGILVGAKAGCVEGHTTPAAGTYHFYQVLLER